MNRVRIDDIPWQEQRSPSGRFQSFCRNISMALGGVRNVGTWGGSHPFDLQLRRIPPGASVCPFHSHLGQWELFVVRTGSGTVRAGAESHPVRVGDVFVHPPGEPHQITSTGEADLEVFIVADNPPLDACHYPDSDKWALRPPMKVFRMTEVDYFDGEEPPMNGALTYRPSAPPPLPPLTPFAQRLLHGDDLAWESWQSPKRKFGGHAKELSIALGARRNTPTGLGGHPFDLELDRLEPGQSACPYHSHSAQWEMYVILGGRATLRVGQETIVASAGEVVLHPPGEAHQIRNAEAEELQFYILADNPPVDVWHYPDSGKWGTREPRLIFRMSEADYYDGEE